MKQKHLHPATGFTVTELLVAVAAGAVVLAAVTVASVALQKSFSAADKFLGTQMQQIRIVDYLSRDVRRSYIVTASSDLKTITCIIPNYLNGNARSTPTVRTTKNGTVVSYPKSRTVTDAVTTNASATLTSATAAFTSRRHWGISCRRQYPNRHHDPKCLECYECDPVGQRDC